MAKRNFDIGDPTSQVAKIDTSKYKIGEQGVPFHDIRKMKPTFAFDYLSLEQSDICFDNPTYDKDDYIGFLTCLKTLSRLDFQTLHDTPNYRFHKIDFDDARVSLTKKD